MRAKLEQFVKRFWRAFTKMDGVRGEVLAGRSSRVGELPWHRTAGRLE
jgi:hypothetical protein